MRRLTYPTHLENTGSIGQPSVKTRYYSPGQNIFGNVLNSLGITVLVTRYTNPCIALWANKITKLPNPNNHKHQYKAFYLLYFSISSADTANSDNTSIGMFNAKSLQSALLTLHAERGTLKFFKGPIGLVRCQKIQMQFSSTRDIRFQKAHVHLSRISKVIVNETFLRSKIMR